MRDLGCPLSATSVQQNKGDQQRCQDGTRKPYSVREEKEHAAQRAASAAVPSEDGGLVTAGGEDKSDLPGGILQPFNCADKTFPGPVI
jgi:hypothetical protein